MRGKNVKIALLLCISLTIGTLAVGCGSAESISQNQISTEQDQETEAVQTEQDTEEKIIDPDLPENAVLDEVYENLNGIIEYAPVLFEQTELRYSYVTIQKKFHINKANYYSYYLVTDEQGKNGVSMCPM